MYPKWQSTQLEFEQGCSGTAETWSPFEHVWRQDAHVFGALPPATCRLAMECHNLAAVGRSPRCRCAVVCVDGQRPQRHPPRAAAARMPRDEGPPTTQKRRRRRGATGPGAGVTAFNRARHPNVTSRAMSARGDGGTGWRRASDGDARAAEEAEHGGLGHLRRCPCCCPCSSGRTALPQNSKIDLTRAAGRTGRFYDDDCPYAEFQFGPR
jgi:hypothetical protein